MAAAKHKRHLQEQRHREGKRNPEVPLFISVLSGTARLFFITSAGRYQPRLVARFVHRVDQCLNADIPIDGNTRFFRREIHRRGNAGNAIQNFLDTRGARGTCHAL